MGRAGSWARLSRCIPNDRLSRTGRGHERIERLFQEGCAERGRKLAHYNEKQPEQRLANWLCCHTTSFVLFDTKARATVIGLERDEDAEAFRREFIKP